MSNNIYYKPIKATGNKVLVSEFTIDLRVEGDGIELNEIVSFPQCLSAMKPEEIKDIVGRVMINYLTRKKELVKADLAEGKVI